MNPLLGFFVIAGGQFMAMLGLLEFGRRIGIRRRVRLAEGSSTSFGAVEGAVFGLMGLLVAFTFSGAAARFDAHRQLIVQEANAIGTAYLRLDLLPPAAQPALREDFRNYLDARLGIYRNLSSDSGAAQAEHSRSIELQEKIWAAGVAACRDAGSPATTSLVLSSLNEMIDITTTRAVAFETHPPHAIYWTLILLVLASSLLAGYDLADFKTRSWMHMLVYAAALSAAVYIILDLEYPRLALIRLDAADKVLIDLRNSMK